MLRKSWLAPLVLSVAGLFVLADTAEAQRGRGRGGWGGNRSGWSIGIGPGGIYGGYSSGGGNWGRGGGWGGNYWGGYPGSYYGRGYYGGGLLGSVLGGGYYGSSYPYYGGSYYGSSYPYYNTYSYSYPSYSYAYPSTTYAYPSSSYSYFPSTTYYGDVANTYPAPATSSYYAPPAQTSNDTANVRVILPDPQAQVWFDGNLTQQTGTDRLFHTPPLSASASNTYRVRASWTEDNRVVQQERVVNVSPGGHVLVDFTQSN
jgi:uncharacterized protein (TIGR03000 family)